MLAPGAIVDPEDLRVPGEMPGTPIVVLDDLGELPHGGRFRARQGKRLLLLTVLTPEVSMQRELRDLLTYRIVQAGELLHPNLLPTYGFVRLPLPGEDGFDTLFIVRPDPGCPTLRQWLHEVWTAGHVLDPLNAVAIGVQVCEALAVLHERFAHGYVTADNVFMYPTGGMPQVLLTAAGEGVVLPFAPGFERFVQAGLLPIASRELIQPPHEPRVETDVLGVAALVFEILTGQPLEPGMSLDRFGFPPRLARVLAVASAVDPEDRPKDILMFSRRLQAAVGLGEDPVEPHAVLEPVQHGEQADPRYPAVRAQPWRPPAPPPPPWARPAPTPGSGAWNVGTPVPGSGAWNVGQRSGSWANPLPGATPSPVAIPPTPAAPTLGRSFPAATRNEPSEPNASFFGSTGDGSFDAPARPASPTNHPPSSPAPAARRDARTKVFAGPPPPPGSTPVPARAPVPPPASLAPPPPIPLPPTLGTAGSVSIVMPAPDGSVLASVSQGPRDYRIVRRGKAHGPYDLAQLERLIPMGKLLSVDTIELISSGVHVLAVDLPGLRPLFEAKAREQERAPAPPVVRPPTPTPEPERSRAGLWVIVGILFVGLLAVGGLLLLQ